MTYIKNGNVARCDSKLPMEYKNSDNCTRKDVGSKVEEKNLSNSTIRQNAAIKKSDFSQFGHPNILHNGSKTCPENRALKLFDCDDTSNDMSTPALKSDGNSCEERSSETENEAKASSFTDNCSQATSNNATSENLVSTGSTDSCESADADVKKLDRKELIPKSLRDQKCFEDKSLSSSSKLFEEKTNSCDLPHKMENTQIPKFDDDSSSTDTSSCDSTSSSIDFITMFSSSEDEEIEGEEDDNFGFEDEQKSETDDDKLPPVLRKTLPVDKFSFTKEVFLRQVNCGDSKRRHYSNFEKKVHGSRVMVQRLRLFKSLKKHNGCVNTLSFNGAGNILISASDDRHVNLWNWAENKNLLHFDSGHNSNVFQAKFLPHSNDRTLISCGLDAQVRKCLLDGCGLKSTTLITTHGRAVHKIAMQPQMPNCFLTAGEDGVIYSIDARENNNICTNLLKVYGHRLNSMASICLYSIDCNPIKNFEFIVGGRCETVRLYDQRNISSKRQNPVHEFRVGSDSSDQEEGTLETITCAVYNHNGTEILASYYNNDVFLFNSNEPSRYAFRYDGHRNIRTIKKVNFYGPQSEFVVSGSDCGYIYIWDKKSESVVQWLKGDTETVNCLEPHPSFPVLATSGLDFDVKVWMPTLPDGCENITNKKEFQKAVKRNLYLKGCNTLFQYEPELENFYRVRSMVRSDTRT